jgi:hypothetical protein
MQSVNLEIGFTDSDPPDENDWNDEAINASYRWVDIDHEAIQSESSVDNECGSTRNLQGT